MWNACGTSLAALRLHFNFVFVFGFVASCPRRAGAEDLHPVSDAIGMLLLLLLLWLRRQRSGSEFSLSKKRRRSCAGCTRRVPHLPLYSRCAANAKLV